MNLATYISVGEKVFRPKLTLFIQLEDGLAVDATLSTETRKFLKSLALSQNLMSPGEAVLETLPGEINEQEQLELLKA